tara:strand:+ start:206 stop:688 length:483 start_codon:yes stop_codon:yes gene_type:complete
MEEWRDVVGFEGFYQVSNFGNIKNTKTKLIKKIQLNVRLNRPQICLSKFDKVTTVYPHKLVMEAFVGKRPVGMECCHADGDPWNNNLSNLRWDTRINNSQDKFKHGTQKLGENHPMSKLTIEKVLKIRQDNRVHRLIAFEYGVSQSVISQIKSKKSWAHI